MTDFDQMAREIVNDWPWRKRTLEGSGGLAAAISAALRQVAERMRERCAVAAGQAWGGKLGAIAAADAIRALPVEEAYAPLPPPADPT